MHRGRSERSGPRPNRGDSPLEGTEGVDELEQRAATTLISTQRDGRTGPAMLLQSNESKLRSAYAVMEGYGPAAYQGPGVLYLTTHRLIFESSVSTGFVRGLVRGKETVTILEASLLHVRNIFVRKGRLGRPRLQVELTAGRPSFDVLDPDAWIAAVALAKRSLSFPAPGGAVATHTIERQVVKVRCRYCGGLGNEVDGRCPTCGAAL